MIAKVKLAWAWLMANLWSLWALVCLGIAAAWLIGRRRPSQAAPADLSKRVGAPAPSVWEEAAAFGAEEAQHHREIRERIITERERELGHIQEQREDLDKIQKKEDTAERNEEMAAWLENNL